MRWSKFNLIEMPTLIQKHADKNGLNSKVLLKNNTTYRKGKFL